MSKQDELEQENKKLREKLVLVESKNDYLEMRLRALHARIFGKKTERYPDHPLLPFAEPEEPKPPHVDEAPDDEGEEEQAKSPKKKRKSRATRLGPDLPRDEEIIEPTPEERVCSCCGEEREIIGYEETQKLQYIPGSMRIRVIRRPKLACKKHEEAGIVTPELPPQVIAKGLASESMLAQVVTAKYRDHLPLYRQSGIYRRHGAQIPESTLGDWIKVSAELLQPIVGAMHKRILRGDYIGTDDTSITVCGGPKKGGSKRAFIWSYIGELGDVVMDFTQGRSRDGPQRMLKGFAGYLQADAYAGYTNLYQDGSIKEVGCMAHARRRFFEALDTEKEHAETALACIGRLYAVERAAKELDPDERQALRKADAAPVFSELYEWLFLLQDHVLPKSPIGKATSYFVKNADALKRYMDDPRLRIDNNRTERTMRQVAVGRKNWMFAGSEAGGHRAATLYSLTISCWELGIDPFVYLSDVLGRLSSTPSSEIESLTPRNWKQALGR